MGSCSWEVARGKLPTRSLMGSSLVGSSLVGSTPVGSFPQGLPMGSSRGKVPMGSKTLPTRCLVGTHELLVGTHEEPKASHERVLLVSVVYPLTTSLRAKRSIFPGIRWSSEVQCSDSHKNRCSSLFFLLQKKEKNTDNGFSTLKICVRLFFFISRKIKKQMKMNFWIYVFLYFFIYLKKKVDEQVFPLPKSTSN